MSGFKAWCEAWSDFISGRAAYKKQCLLDQQERERQWLELANKHLEGFLADRFPAEFCFSEIISESGDRYRVRVIYEKGTAKREMVQGVYRSMIADSDQRYEWLRGIMRAMERDLGIDGKDERQ